MGIGSEAAQATGSEQVTGGEVAEVQDTGTVEVDESLDTGVDNDTPEVEDQEVPNTDTDTVEDTDADTDTNEAPENDEPTDQNNEPVEIVTLRKEHKAMKAQLEKIRQTNERVRGLWEQFPEVPGLISDLDQGLPLSVALARNFDLEDIKPMEGDADFDQYKQAKEERVERYKKAQEQQKVLEQNMEFTAKELEEFKKENKLTTEEADKFFDNVNQFLDQIFQGKVDRKILSMFQRAMNADKEIETARKQAELKAKNEKIVTEKKTEKNKKGDGLPSLNKGQFSPEDSEDAPPPADPFASALTRMRDRRRF